MAACHWSRLLTPEGRASLAARQNEIAGPQGLLTGCRTTAVGWKDALYDLIQAVRAVSSELVCTGLAGCAIAFQDFWPGTGRCIFWLRDDGGQTAALARL